MPTMQTFMVLYAMTFSIVCAADTDAVNGIVTPKPFKIGCDTYGTVTLSNFTQGEYSWFQYTCTNGSANYSANNNISSDGRIILNHCYKNHPIELAILKTKPSTLLITSPNRITGYTIICRDQNNTKTNVTVSVTESSQHFTEKATNVLYTLSMRLQNNGSNSDAVATVVLGKPYDLVISGMGAYFVKPTTCSASMSSSYEKGSTVTILNKTSASHVLEAFEMKPNSHEVHATLHGFRLLYSDKVYIKCEVDVCVHEHDCHLTTGSGSNSGTGSKGGSNSGTGSKGGSNSGTGNKGGSNSGTGNKGGSNSGTGNKGGSNSGTGSKGGSNSGTGNKGGSNSGTGSKGGSNSGTGSKGGSNSGTGSKGGSNSGTGNRRRRRAAGNTLFKGSVEVYFTTFTEDTVASGGKGLMFPSSCIIMAVLVHFLNKP